MFTTMQQVQHLLLACLPAAAESHGPDLYCNSFQMYLMHDESSILHLRLPALSSHMLALLTWLWTMCETDVGEYLELVMLWQQNWN